MSDQVILALALPILGFILVIAKVIASTNGGDFSLRLRGLGVDLHIQKSGDSTRNKEI